MVLLLCTADSMPMSRINWCDIETTMVTMVCVWLQHHRPPPADHPQLWRGLCDPTQQMHRDIPGRKFNHTHALCFLKMCAHVCCDRLCARMLHFRVANLCGGLYTKLFTYSACWRPCGMLCLWRLRPCMLLTPVDTNDDDVVVVDSYLFI